MTDLMTVQDVNRSEEEFINALIESKGDNLPAQVEEVLQVFEFTDWKAKAWKSMSDKLSRLDDQTEAYHSALRSGQHWGIAALYAQKRMGEITRAMPKADPNDVRYGRSVPGATDKRTILTKTGISSQNASDAERIAANPEILDRVIENARQRGEIPTKTAVLNTIKVEAARDRHEVQKKKYEDSVDNQRDRAVADYYEAIKGFKAALDFARIAAERGKFAPEGKSLLLKKHEEIKSMMSMLEELV